MHIFRKICTILINVLCGAEFQFLIYIFSFYFRLLKVLFMTLFESEDKICEGEVVSDSFLVMRNFDIATAIICVNQVTRDKTVVDSIGLELTNFLQNQGKTQVNR